MSIREAGGVEVTYPETPTAFAIPATVTGEAQVGHGSIWLGQSIGSVVSGMYEGTQLIATGNKGAAVAAYVKRGGKDVGTIVINLGTIFTAAVEEFERIAREQAAFPVDHEEGE